MTLVKIGVSTNRMTDYTPMAYSLNREEIEPEMTAYDAESARQMSCAPRRHPVRQGLRIEPTEALRDE